MRGGACYAIPSLCNHAETPNLGTYPTFFIKIHSAIYSFYSLNPFIAKGYERIKEYK